MAFLYQPEVGVLADVIPYYWQGRFHVLYLQLKPGQKGFDWAQLLTRDFVSYEHAGIAIPGGGTDDAIDRDIFTGSVIEKDGVLYAFYTGHNHQFPGYECPDLFRWGERWYLLFSTYAQNPGWATRYMTAPSLAGPWESPADDFLDGASLYAAKSVSDGRRRFLCGTLPRRQDNRDDGENGWAGRLLVYEVLQRSGGQLGVRIPAEVERSFGTPAPVQLPAVPGWERTAQGLRNAAGQARLGLGKLPPRCLLSVRLTVPPTGRAGIWLGGDAKGEQAFRLSVDVGTQRLVWDRGALPMGSNPEKERPYRPLHVQPGERIVLKVALDGDAAVACAGDSVCLATRIYNRRDDAFGIWADTTGAAFEAELSAK